MSQVTRARALVLRLNMALLTECGVSAFPWSINMAPLTGWDRWLCYIAIHLVAALLRCVSVVRWCTPAQKNNQGETENAEVAQRKTV